MKTLFFLYSLLIYSALAIAENREIYHINTSLNSELYYIQESLVEGKVVQKWVPVSKDVRNQISIYFAKSDLVNAEEIVGSNGINYLRVPYGDKPKNPNSTGSIAPYFLIPEFPNNRRNEDHKVNRPNYQKTVPGTKGIGAMLSGREDRIVYQDLPYPKVLALTDEPQADIKKCIKGFESLNCMAWPSSQDELKVIDTKILQTRDPASGKRSMELYYKVDTSYTRHTCGLNEKVKSKDVNKLCPKKTVNAQGWLPARRALDFKYEDRIDADEEKLAKVEVLSFTDEELKRFDTAIKDQEKQCDVKRTPWQGMEDNKLFLEQAKEFPFAKDDIGKCVGKEYIAQMNESDQMIEAKYEPLIKAELSKSPNDTNKILDLEMQRNAEENKARNAIWTDAKNTPFDTYLRSYWEQKFSGPEAKKYTALNMDQMLSIDALARTLYGEMRESECSGDTSSFYKIIAKVMLNRAALIKKKNGVVEAFITKDSIVKIGNAKSASIYKILPHVLGAPSQISSWNPGEPNLKVNLYPDQNPENPDEKRAWEMAKAVAKEAILNTPRFLEETKDIDYL